MQGTGSITFLIVIGVLGAIAGAYVVAVAANLEDVSLAMTGVWLMGAGLAVVGIAGLVSGHYRRQDRIISTLEDLGNRIDAGTGQTRSQSSPPSQPEAVTKRQAKPMEE